LYFRHAQGLPMDEPLAAWESPPSLVFSSVRALQEAADAQGLKHLFYDGPDALFPDFAAGTANFWADAEELVWELACEQTDDPEDATTWPAGFALLQFLAFWRLALNESGAHLELVHT
jgi:hypothetical protein